MSRLRNLLFGVLALTVIYLAPVTASEGCSVPHGSCTDFRDCTDGKGACAEGCGSDYNGSCTCGTCWYNCSCGCELEG